MKKIKSNILIKSYISIKNKRKSKLKIIISKRIFFPTKLLFIILIYIILSKINNNLFRDSYIVIKINQKGFFRIFFTGDSVDSLCTNINHAPTSVIINNIPEESLPNEYEFTSEQNTIKLYFPEEKPDYKCLFYQCTAINEIDLSNFSASNVIVMDCMFLECSSLTSITFGNIGTQRLQYSCYMFCGCSALTILDLSMFNTQSLISMVMMFGLMNNLTSINLSNLDLSNVVDMNYLFHKCSNLKEINLNNIKTDSLETMKYMFYGCSSLTSIDLSSINTSKVKDMEFVFGRCSSLTSLNLSNFDTSNVEVMADMFHECASLINPIICLDNIQSLNKIISSSKYPFENCNENFEDYINNTFVEKNIICLNGCLLKKYDEGFYRICSYYFYFDKDLNEYLCTPELKCPENYSKLISEKKECVEASYEPTENTYYFPTCTKEKPFLISIY